MLDLPPLRPPVHIVESAAVIARRGLEMTALVLLRNPEVRQHLVRLGWQRTDLTLGVDVGDRVGSPHVSAVGASGAVGMAVVMWSGYDAAGGPRGLICARSQP